MGVRTMLKAVLLLAWLCVVGAQFIGGSAVIFPDHGGASQPVPVFNNRQSAISNKPRCADHLEENAPCIDDEDYNSNVKARFRHLLHRFRGNEVVTNQVFQELSKPEIIDDPLDPTRVNQYDPLCASKESIVYPKRAKTQSNDWVFVLNQPKNRQAVKVERCINNNQGCRLGAASTEVETVCRQKYIYKKLLVMNGAGTDIVPESVLMPSCCVCYIKKQNRSPFPGFGLRSNFTQLNNRGNNVGTNLSGRGNNFGSINRQGNTANIFPDRRLNTRINQG